tara:strand:+ start:4495 stop:4851 length:357 start_codon:yes stop_codon:yes gene_type:complete
MGFHTTSTIKAEWSRKYGKVTTINFIIYGEVGERDISVINYSLRKTFQLNKFIQTLEIIDSEKAEMFNMYRGTGIQWVFPNEIENQEKIIKLISEGLEFLKLKNECIGVSVDVYERTT